MPRRRTRLTTVGQVVSEMGCVYRDARRSALPWSDAASAARILTLLRQAMETSNLEQRLAAVEATLEAERGRRTRPPVINGHYDEASL